MGCPNDTDGDGDCGRPACPHCGNSFSMMLAPKNPPIEVEDELCVMIKSRQALGIKKYGQTVMSNPGDLRYWLQHTLEETLDKAVYLRRAIRKLDEDAAKAQRVAAVAKVFS